MSSASGLQLRRKTYAGLIALWLVSAGVLARRHEALVAHAVEASTGALVHGDRLVGHHDDKLGSDIHGRNGAAADHGECGELAVLHQIGIAVAAPGWVATVADPGEASCLTHDLDARSADSIYLIAPKTSPPIA